MAGKKKRGPNRNRKDVLRQAKKVDINIEEINYKNVETLKQFLGKRQKILSQKDSGLNAKQQRKLKNEVKKARIMGLLPFTDRHALS